MGAVSAVNAISSMVQQCMNPTDFNKYSAKTQERGGYRQFLPRHVPFYSQKDHRKLETALICYSTPYIIRAKLNIPVTIVRAVARGATFSDIQELIHEDIIKERAYRKYNARTRHRRRC